jgi:Arc/MetJ-type ribon-helix-helix transcriptional regulator
MLTNSRRARIAYRMSDDDKKLPRVIVVMTPEQVAEIDAERRIGEGRIQTRSEAIRAFVREAIAARRASRIRTHKGAE